MSFPFPIDSPPAVLNLPHRAWRVYVTQPINSNNYTEMAELRFLRSVGDPAPLSGSAIVSSSFGGSVGPNLFDSNNSTFWTSANTSSPQWAGYDFGSGNAYNITAITITPNDTGRAPKVFQVEYSDDLVTWYSASWQIFDQDSWTTGVTKTFLKPTGPVDMKRVWRVYVTATNNGSADYTEITDMTFNQANGTAAPLNGYAFGSSQFGASSPSRAFDASTGTFWTSSSTSLPQWVAYDFGYGQEIKSVTITGASSVGRSPKDFNIQYSNDNATWNTAWSITGVTSWTSLQTKTFLQSDPYWHETVLLAGLSGTNGSTTFTDESSFARTLTTNGNAQVSSAQTLFGRNTGLFDGTGDYITAAHNTLLSVANSTPKTIEAWFQITTANRIHTIMGKRDTSSAQEFSLQITAANVLQMACFASGSSVMTMLGTTTLSTGVWYHVAVVRTTGGAWTMYLDGAVEASGTESATPTSNTVALYIGRDNFNTARDFAGYLAEVRYTNAARYTGAFTRPSTIFTRAV